MTVQVHSDPEFDGPIVLYATKGFDSYTFALDVDSRDLLRELDPLGSALPRRITIALELEQPFEKAFESVHRHVIPLLTNRTLDELRALGGVEVRDAKTDQVMWQEPSSRSR